jgi:DMSO reductase anchor subunit
MGYRIARKHARKLRRIALLGGFVVPFALIALALAIGGPLRAFAAILAALTTTAGIGIERWLFFAEAKHTVTLYYGEICA